MRNAFEFPKRVCVTLGEGEYALGDLKYTTIDGRFVVHIDGECAEHTWDASDIEFLEGGN